MTSTIPKPIGVREAYISELPKHYRKAAQEAINSYGGVITGDEEARIETYRTEDIRHLVEDVWDWPVTLARLEASPYSKADAGRVRDIMGLIGRGKPRWPYVSYEAEDMNELAGVNDFGPINHGDGWHRIIAAVELGLPTIEVMFLFK
jgi:hypothetical protein